MERIIETDIETNGVRLHVRSEGPENGPLIVLLHGFPEFSYSWRHQFPALAEAGWRAAAPDLRGYAASDKPGRVRDYQLSELTRDVAGLVHALGRDRAVVVGHDWGGFLAWRFAMEYPDLVSRLVILNAPHPGKVRDGVHGRQYLRSWYIGFFQIPFLPEWLIAHNARRIAEGIRASAVRREAFTDADIEVYSQAMRVPGAMRAGINYYRAWVRGGMALPIQPILAPTLMIWGQDDAALGLEMTYGTERWVRDFRIHYIPRCGHWVQNEAADEVNRTMLEFIQEAA